jgi:hypothetical protein
MPVRLLLPILLLLCFNTGINSQDCSMKVIKKLVKKINEPSEKGVLQDSVMKQIQSSNDLVIGYSEYNQTWRHVPTCYYLICFIKRKCMAYKYTIRSYSKPGEKFFQLDTITLTQKTINSVISNVKNNKPWEIKHNEDTELDECKHVSIEKSSGCSISDASSKSLFLLTKTHHFITSFYAPEFYEYSCCPGNVDRQLFLSTIAPIYSFFLNSNKQEKD